MSTTTARWLIVLDDLVDVGGMAGLWPPTVPNGRVLVTTRRLDAALASHGRVISVGLFTPEEAKRYLLEKFASVPGNLVESDRLADDLGYLPLAMAQAAAYVSDRNITCAEYRRRFADERRLLASLTPRPGELPDDYHLPVTASLALSLRAASALDPTGLAVPLMALLALLESDGVPDKLLEDASVHSYLADCRGVGPDDQQTGEGDLARPGSNDRTTRPGELPTVDAEVAHDALSCLTRLNLASIEPSPPLADGRPRRWRTVRVHSLVQRATRDCTTRFRIMRYGPPAVRCLGSGNPQTQTGFSPPRSARRRLAARPR